MRQIIMKPMNTSGLTEKRMRNRRFFNNEQAIFIAYYKFKDYPSAKKLARIAGVSRSTLYRHHKKIQLISSDYEDYLLKNYRKTIKRFLKNNSSLKNIYLRTLVFISSNREVFKALFRENHKDIIKKMINSIKPKILTEWHLSGNLDKIYGIYANEVLAIMEIWHKANFSNQTLESALSDILYLTKSSRRSLLSLQQPRRI